MINKLYDYLSRQLTYLLLALLLPISLYAQTSDNTTYYEISFLLKYNLIVLEIAVDGRKGNFIVDTGSSYLILNKAYSKSALPTSRIFDLDGAKISALSKTICLKIGNWEIKNTEVISMDLSHLERKMKIPIMGLLGMDILENFELLFNYKKTSITFFQLDEHGNKLKKAPNLKPVATIPIYFKGHLPCIKAIINDKTFYLSLDSGSSINLFSVKNKKYITSKTFSKPIKIAGIKKSSKISKHTFFKSSIQVGNYTTLPMLMLFKKIPSLNYYLTGISIDGLLGFEFFSQQKIAINFRKKELYLWQRKSAIKKLEKVSVK